MQQQTAVVACSSCRHYDVESIDDAVDTLRGLRKLDVSHLRPSTMNTSKCAPKVHHESSPCVPYALVACIKRVRGLGFQTWVPPLASLSNVWPHSSCVHCLRIYAFAAGRGDAKRFPSTALANSCLHNEIRAQFEYCPFMISVNDVSCAYTVVCVRCQSSIGCSILHACNMQAKHGWLRIHYICIGNVVLQLGESNLSTTLTNML